ncbi:hypothetical protein [Dongia rigui]|uniref:Uncharacterized protein n=1 Tax=Dongia rigui TaxID=940149 RepID=A0ABU5E2N1_9PROT|nr:hypothetical protein [Dongia rigui]MDY0873562.1 hypothetical protein [Dongia rigui]
MPLSRCWKYHDFSQTQDAMIDIFYTAIAVSLFVAACGYAWACAKI